MSYPKPLSEKSLERLYKESGLTKEARTFLHVFFAACANLYGAIALRHMWGIYRELTDAPKLRRKDMLTFASIVRREEQPYYVFEVNELFDEDFLVQIGAADDENGLHPTAAGLLMFGTERRITKE